jgi:hypothetical protein
MALLVGPKHVGQVPGREHAVRARERVVAVGERTAADADARRRIAPCPDGDLAVAADLERLRVLTARRRTEGAVRVLVADAPTECVSLLAAVADAVDAGTAVGAAAAFDVGRTPTASLGAGLANSVDALGGEVATAMGVVDAGFPEPVASAAPVDAWNAVGADVATGAAVKRRPQIVAIPTAASEALGACVAALTAVVLVRPQVDTRTGAANAESAAVPALAAVVPIGVQIDAGVTANGLSLRTTAGSVDALSALRADGAARTAIVRVGVEFARFDALTVAKDLAGRARAESGIAKSAAAGDRVGAFPAGFGLTSPIRRFGGNAAAAEPDQRAGQDTAGKRFHGCAAGMVSCQFLG